MDREDTAGKIKAEREKRGLTQAELAEKVGTTPQNISQYERGIRKPKYQTLQKIASALGVEWYDLFVPQSEDEEIEARSLRVLSVDGNLEKAQEDLKEIQEDDRLFDLILEYTEQLNEAGLISLSQLVLSIVARDSIINNNPHRWVTDILSNCVYGSSDAVNETLKGVKLLAQIPAYQRQPDAPQDAPGRSDDKEPAEK